LRDETHPQKHFSQNIFLLSKLSSFIWRFFSGKIFLKSDK
jgi:hypothetical protein